MMFEDIVSEEVDQRSKWQNLVSRIIAVEVKENWMSPTAVLGPTKGRTPRHALMYTVWKGVKVIALEA